jgi:hypothetical protein
MIDLRAFEHFNEKNAGPKGAARARRLPHARGGILLGAVLLSSAACIEDLQRADGGGGGGAGVGGGGGAPTSSSTSGGGGGASPTQAEPASAFVNAGETVGNAKHRMVLTTGQSTPGQAVMTSSKHVMVGGVLGATGSR